MKDAMKKSLQRIGLHTFAVKTIFNLRRFSSFFLRGHLFKLFILRRFYKNPVRKIHLGCGERKLKGWLNADLYTGDIYLDLNKKLPLKNDSIDYVYSHHVIEHLEQDKALRHFSELYRVCRNGAKIRLVTPDLDMIVKIFSEPEKYKEIIEFYCKDTKFVHQTEFLNLAIRQFGEHKYLYNFDFLKMLLENSGFKNVVQKQYGKSEDPVFDKLDLHGYEMIERISLAVEAEK